MTLLTSLHLMRHQTKLRPDVNLESIISTRILEKICVDHRFSVVTNAFPPSWNLLEIKTRLQLAELYFYPSNCTQPNRKFCFNRSNPYLLLKLCTTRVGIEGRGFDGFQGTMRMVSLLSVSRLCKDQVVQESLWIVCICIQKIFLSRMGVLSDRWNFFFVKGILCDIEKLCGFFMLDR